MKTDQFSTVKALHRLLLQALLEIRSQGEADNNQVVFHLADLFHTTVLDMELAAQGESTYEEAIRDLAKKAREKGLSRWLESQTGKTKSRCVNRQLDSCRTNRQRSR